PGTEGIRVTPTQTSALVRGLRNRSRYTFTVAAKNAAGEGVSAPSNAVWPGDDVPPYLFALELISLLVLGLVAFLYALHYAPFTFTFGSLGHVTIPTFREMLPPAVAGVPISIPGFGALRGRLAGLFGIFGHGPRGRRAPHNAV